MSTRAAERAAVAAMVGATLLWGGTFVAIRDVVRDLSPVALVGARFTVATALMAVVALVRRRAPDRASLVVGLGNGLFMCGSFSLQALGLRSTSAGSSAFLTCTGTLFAALHAWLLLRQRPGRAVAAGIALALAGSALMSLDGALHLGRGELITLAGASLYAMEVVWTARGVRGADPLSVVGVQSAVIALLLAAPARGAFAALPSLGAATAWRFGYLAVAGSAIAPLLQVSAQRHVPAARIGLLLALEPVFALVFALTLGGERFVPRWWAGAALILIAVAAVEWRAASTTRPSASS